MCVTCELHAVVIDPFRVSIQFALVRYNIYYSTSSCHFTHLIWIVQQQIVAVMTHAQNQRQGLWEMSFKSYLDTGFSLIKAHSVETNILFLIIITVLVFPLIKRAAVIKCLFQRWLLKLQTQCTSVFHRQPSIAIG